MNVEELVLRDRAAWRRWPFDRLSSQNRCAVLLRIDQAKRADTRLRRIEAFAAVLARGEAANRSQARSCRAIPPRGSRSGRRRARGSARS